MSYRKHIDDFFREKLGKYRETPPPEVWEELAGRLDGMAPATPAVSYRWLWHIAIVSVIVLLSVSAGRKLMNQTDSSDGNAPLNVSANTSTNTNTTTPAPVNNVKPMAVQENNPDKGNITPAPANSTSAGTAVPNPQTAGNNNNPQSNTAIAMNKGSKAKPGLTNKNYVPKSVTPNKTENQFAANNYTSKPLASNPAPDETNENDPTNASPNTTLSVVTKPETIPATVKKDVTGIKKQMNVADGNKTKNRPAFARLEAGVKMGFEGGTTNDAARKFVVSPYAQFNLSPKLSIMVQPGVKIANVPDRNIGSPESYYSINEDGRWNQGPTTKYPEVIGGHLDTISVTRYTYSQTHDSIVKSHKIGGTTMQYELPILLKYNLTKSFSVYGGLNLVYSQLIDIKENTYAVKNIYRSVDYYDTFTVTPNGHPASSGLGYAGVPYPNDYKNTVVPAHTGNEFSVGYMVGFTYAYHKKWLFDALVQQSPVRSDVKAGYNINNSLSVPYFRLSIGYKLTK